MTIDNFGNLITNIEAGDFAAFRAPGVAHRIDALPLLKTYGRAVPGDYLALVNSFGVVEIARAEGNAADGLGIERGAPVSVIDSP